MTRTVKFHWVFLTTLQKIHKAVLDVDAMGKCLPPYGFTCKVHHMDIGKWVVTGDSSFCKSDALPQLLQAICRRQFSA